MRTPEPTIRKQASIDHGMPFAVRLRRRRDGEDHKREKYEKESHGWRSVRLTLAAVK